MIDSILDELDDKLEDSGYEVEFSAGYENTIIELVYEQEIVMIGQLISGEVFGFGLPIEGKHHEMVKFVKESALKINNLKKQECDSDEL